MAVSATFCSNVCRMCTFLVYTRDQQDAFIKIKRHMVALSALIHYFLQLLGALCSCLLPEGLQVTTVKQLPEYHGCSGECSTSNLSRFYSSVYWLINQISLACLLMVFFPCSEEDVTESLSTTTHHESTEMEDAKQERHLLSTPSSSGEVCFVKETVQKWIWTFPPLVCSFSNIVEGYFALYLLAFASSQLICSFFDSFASLNPVWYDSFVTLLL